MARRAFVVGGAITPFIGARHPDFIKPKDPRYGTPEGKKILLLLSVNIGWREGREWWWWWWW